MNKTGYLIFEVGKTCNLGKSHAACPNLHPQRFLGSKTIPDAKVVEIVREMHEVHGFRGRIGWHYYNEPLMAEARLWRLMDAIDAVIPTARYTLWTNGTRWPKKPDNLIRFEEVHLTDYRLPEYPVDLAAWREFVPHLQVHHWPLDDRITAISGPLHHPCRRMFTEFIVDYYGTVHLCCYDWRGLGSPGNVHEHTTAELVERWQAIRARISGSSMTDEAPDACLRCAKRSSGITQFVPEVAKDAEAYARGLR
jgi:hypothetical protein